jgi:Tfp pilus assembly protein PilV
MPSPGRSSRAFSLVEVMMAAVILLVGFIGLIDALTLSSQLLDNARKQQMAAQIIDGELDALHACSWTTLTSMADGVTYTMTVDNAGNAGGSVAYFSLTNNTGMLAQAKGFSCTLVASYKRPNGATAATVTFVKVSCTVTWTGNTGKSYARTTEAYYSKYGLNISYQKS